MKATTLFMTFQAPAINSGTGYVIGMIIAVLLLGYLLYALIKPEKF